jgi:pimeloyl-ACP methyl ester carboxylesterase
MILYKLFCDVAHTGTILLLLYGPFCIYTTILTLYNNTKFNGNTNHYIVHFQNIPWYNYYFFFDANFYLYLLFVKYYGNITSKPLPYINDTFPLHRRRRVFRYLLEFVHSQSVAQGQAWITNWFLDETRRIAPAYTELGMPNILDFFAYLFFRQGNIDNLDELQLKEITSYAQLICSKLGKVTNKRNNKFHAMRPPCDSIIPMCQEAPILYYLFFDFCIRYLCTEIMFLRMKYTRRNDIEPLKYFVKKSINKTDNHNIGIEVSEKKWHDYSVDRNTDDNIPLIFFHGLGAGLSTYYLLFQYFINSKKFENRTVIIIDMPYVSIEFPKIFFSAPTIQEMNIYIETIVRRECPCFSNKQKVTIDILAHSYGTFVAANLIYTRNNVKARHAIIVDPVAIQLFRSTLCKTFLYTRKVNREDLVDILSLHAMKDISIARTLMRHGDWFDSNIWLEDVLSYVDSIHVFMAGNDKFVPVKHIEESILRVKLLHGFNDCQMSSCLLPHTGHGTFFYVKNEIAHVIKLLEGSALQRHGGKFLKRAKEKSL